MKWNEILPPTAMWRDQSYGFLVDWLKNIQSESKRKKPKRGMPYKRTLKQWGKWYSEQQVADIARGATKIMDIITNTTPSIKSYL